MTKLRAHARAGAAHTNKKAIRDTSAVLQYLEWRCAFREQDGFSRDYGRSCWGVLFHESSINLERSLPATEEDHR
ncbi:hypothetical protein N7447_007462 [Penicillium robsamsonii]|uniref:uncharacterized protein n=1 Tax=Penicillium robsamsonii TaxID=1792511 RepID=UPI002549092C|nr:uncharacterized protein N7447_007462 [Penicillium robsamsonii]KAJ5825122.1 hypothetical protein N7447_007462 [Penicillium robsamsonii]